MCYVSCVHFFAYNIFISISVFTMCVYIKLNINSYWCLQFNPLLERFQHPASCNLLHLQWETWLPPPVIHLLNYSVPVSMYSDFIIGNLCSCGKLSTRAPYLCTAYFAFSFTDGTHFQDYSGQPYPPPSLPWNGFINL